MAKRKSSRWAFMSRKPQRAFMSLCVTADGGDIREDSVSRVRHATIKAFAEACQCEGLRFSWEVEAKSMDPARFLAMMVRKGHLAPNHKEPLELPPAADAVARPAANELDSPTRV